VDPPPPAHIHVHLAADGMPDHWIDSFVFTDDPLANRAVLDKNHRSRPLLGGAGDDAQP
jgi:hypothetical protein